MKRNLRSTLLLFGLTAVHVPAYAELYINYCKESIRSGFSNSNASAQVSAATAFTPEMCVSQGNFAIRALDFGLYDVSKLASIKFWMRHHLNDAQNLLEWEMDPSTVTEGWNRIVLDQNIDLAGVTDTLYFGYDYKQSAKSAKVVGVSGDKQPCSVYGAANGKWKDYSSTYSPLALRGVLVGTVANDVRLLDLTTTNRTQLLKTGEEAKPIVVNGRLINLGSETMTSFTIAWEDESVRGSQEFVCDLPSCEACDFTFSFGTTYLNDNNRKLNVQVQPGALETLVDDNAGALYYEVLEEQKIGKERENMLLEQYLSLNNGEVPWALRQYDEMIEKSCECLHLNENRFVLINLHNGYGPADKLRVTDNNPYSARAIFGPEALQYAPGISFNHTHVTSGTLPVDSIVNAMAAAWQEHPYQFSTIQGTATREAGNTVSVNLSVSSATLMWCQDPVLVVCVTSDEESISAQKCYELPEGKTCPATEHDVACRFLTPAKGYSLLGSNGARLSQTEWDDIALGRVPCGNNNHETHVSFTFSLPDGSDSQSTYHIVAYVCEMSDDSQRVDAVARISIPQ